MITKFFFSVLFTMILLTSCVKTEHKIRFQNLYSLDVENLKIGSDAFGTVASGATSDYQSIPEGSGNITGYSTTGQYLSGSYTVSGKGQHNWTVILSAAGTMSIKNDK
jgi:hypothetical protein